MRVGAWCRALANRILPLVDSDPGRLALIKEQCEDGRFGVFEVTAERVRGRAWLIWCISTRSDGGKVFEINYSAGERGAAALIPQVLSACEAMAEKCGCESVEFITDRGGLVELAERAGWTRRNVLVKELTRDVVEV